MFSSTGGGPFRPSGGSYPCLVILQVLDLV